MKIYATIAFVLGFLMVGLNLYPSWSQYFLEPEQKLLIGCLVCILISFERRSSVGLNRHQILFKNKSIQFMDRFTAFLFACVLIFGVTDPEKWVQTAHMIFTALAIISAYITLIAKQKDKMMKLSTIITVIFCTIAFGVGLLTETFTTASGELITAFPLIIDFYATKTEKV